jgi:hypothetical protein
VRIPITRPRVATNQRLAMVAAKTMATHRGDGRQRRQRVTGLMGAAVPAEDVVPHADAGGAGPFEGVDAFPQLRGGGGVGEERPLGEDFRCHLVLSPIDSGARNVRNVSVRALLTPEHERFIGTGGVDLAPRRVSRS